jgi:hypothetical protein
MDVPRHGARAVVPMELGTPYAWEWDRAGPRRRGLGPAMKLDH